MQESKQTKFYYKAVQSNCEKFNLEKLLSEALSALSDAKARSRTISRVKKITLNSYKVIDNALYCVLFLVDESKEEQELSWCNKKGEYTLNPKQKECSLIMESYLFFGVSENDLIVAQTKKVNTRSLENYLIWILRESELIDQSQSFSLSDVVPIQSVREIVEKQIKYVEIVDPLQVRLKDTKNWDSIVPDSAGANLLDKILPDIFSSKPLLNSIKSTELQVGLTVKYKNRKERDPDKVLAQIANTMRHDYDKKVTIHLKSGGKVQNERLRLIKNNGRIIIKDQILDVDATFNNLHKCLLEWIDNYEI